MSDEKDRLTDHEYDGIREYDNPLPNWWLLTFFATIMFSMLYFLHYMSGSGPSLKQELELAMEEIDRRHSSAPKSEFSEDELLAQMQSTDLVKATEIYEGKCAACHGNALQGVIGPNLTDEFWLHGRGTRKDIVGLIRSGIPEKGMPPWENLLKSEEIVALGALIVAKQDARPEGARPPQGEKVR